MQLNTEEKLATNSTRGFPTKLSRNLAARFGFALLVPLALSCGSNQNKAERERYAKAQGLLPDEPCVNNCVEDPGALPVNCALAEKELEFYSPAIWDFEGGKASNMYVYDDETPTAFRDPSQGWEPPVVTFDPETGKNRIAQRCIAKHPRSNSVMHLQGGMFIGYGGGMGIQLGKKYAGLCSPGSQSNPEHCNEDAEFPDFEMDFSKWDGISFWARRGPEGQSMIRLMIGDKHTDSDMSYMATYNKLNDTGGSTVKYCERIRECGCRNHKPCTEWTGSDYETCSLCFDPEKEEGPDPRTYSCADFDVSSGTSGAFVGEADYYLCGHSACEAIFPSFDGNTQFDNGADPQFNPNDDPDAKRHPRCAEYYFLGGRSGEYCYDPDLETVPESVEQCEDNPFYPVSLSTEWKFYKVRFEDATQQGFGKRSYDLDLDKLSLVRLTWDRGWVDYWIDDVRFYREKRD